MALRLELELANDLAEPGVDDDCPDEVAYEDHIDDGSEVREEILSEIFGDIDACGRSEDVGWYYSGKD